MSERGEAGPSHRDLAHPTLRERWEKADATIGPVKSLVRETDEMRMLKSRAAEVLRQPVAEAMALFRQYAAAAQPTVESYQGKEEYAQANIGLALLMAEMWQESGLGAAAIKEMWDARELARNEHMDELAEAIDHKVSEVQYLETQGTSPERDASP